MSDSLHYILILSALKRKINRNQQFIKIGGIVKKFCILCAVLFGLGACSTAEKAEVKQAEDKATTMAKDAKAKADDKKADAKKSADTAMSASKASCTLDKDTRVIEVKKTESGGCELFYTKFGEAKSVASSGFGTQYCEEVKDRIQSNLDKAGFSCK